MRSIPIGTHVETPIGPGVVEAWNDEPNGYFASRYGEGCWVRMDALTEDEIEVFGIEPGFRALRYYGFHDLKTTTREER
jgi:hypothetical protein